MQNSSLYLCFGILQDIDLSQEAYRAHCLPDEDYDYEYDEFDEVEDYYFSSAAGRH